MIKVPIFILLFLIPEMNLKAPISLGLFGSSHIDHYPLYLFHRHHIHPQIISSSPKNIRDIKKQNTVQNKIAHMMANNITIDMILLIIGANDVGTLSPQEIVQGIIDIANSFSAINIKPIIVPLFNRSKPNNLTVAQYNTIRNKVNSKLRLHYKRHHQYIVIKMHDMHLKDGIHLNEKSYIYLTNAIISHIRKSTLTKYVLESPIGHHTNTITKEEIIAEITTEEIKAKAKSNQN